MKSLWMALTVAIHISCQTTATATGRPSDVYINFVPDRIFFAKCCRDNDAIFLFFVPSHFSSRQKSQVPVDRELWVPYLIMEQPQIEFLYDWVSETYIRPFSDLTCLCGWVKQWNQKFARHPPQTNLLHSCEPANVNHTVHQGYCDEETNTLDPRCSLGTCTTEGVCFKSFVINKSYNKTVFR